MSLAEQLQRKKDKLKENKEGTIVRTKDGLVFRERVDEHGNFIREQIAKENFLIEGAPDPEVCGIIDFLFLGSQDAAANKAELEKKGVKFILNVATGITSLFPNDFTYLEVEMLDVDETKLTDYFPKCFPFIEKAIASKQGILVHCNAGVSRSASIIIAYLMKTYKWNFNKAFSLVKEKRSKIQPNRGFVQQLKEYEELLGIK